MDTLLILVIAPVISILWHEAAHALFALASTRAPVTLRIGFGPSVGLHLGRLELRFGPLLLGGLCSFESTGRRGDRALIAAAGPVSSAFLAALAWSLQLNLAPHDFARNLAEMIVVTSAFGAVFTAIPMRYAPNVDSDGMAVLRAFFPVAATSPRWPEPEPRPRRPLRLPFVLVLAIVIPLAFVVSFWLGFGTSLLFGLVYLGERS